MKTVEIISHCHAMELPHYAWALRYQLSSLVLDKPEQCKVIVSVCFCPEDRRTMSVLGNFFGRYSHLTVLPYALDRGRLGRRAIGRNLAAKQSRADIVWFADVDQCYREGILDRLARMEWPDKASMIYPKEIKIHRDHATGDSDLELASNRDVSLIDVDQCYREGILDRLAEMEWPDKASMIYPKEIKIHRDHATGDADLELASNRDVSLIDVDPDRFVAKRYGRAIGGVQIVRGDSARRHGYLDGDEKWQKPTDGRFARCHCDRPYRSACSRRGPIVSVDLPGLYRLRHSEAAHGKSPSIGGAGFKEGS